MVVLFHAESGEIREVAATIEEWAGRILTEYEILTGHPFAHDWQGPGDVYRQIRDLPDKSRVKLRINR